MLQSLIAIRQLFIDLHNFGRGTQKLGIKGQLDELNTSKLLRHGCSGGDDAFDFDGHMLRVGDSNGFVSRSRLRSHSKFQAGLLKRLENKGQNGKKWLGVKLS